MKQLPTRVAIVHYPDDPQDLGVVYVEDSRHGPLLTVVWPNKCNGGNWEADPVDKRQGRYKVAIAHSRYDDPESDYVTLTTVRRLGNHPVNKPLEQNAADRVNWHRSQPPV